MKQEWNTNEFYESFQDELFEGDLRKLGELINQLELWSDEKTINHKKEQQRLEEYMELDYNLYELRNKLINFIKMHEAQDESKEEAKSYETSVEEKFSRYLETEEVIHNWIKEIKTLYEIIAKSSILGQYREKIIEIVER